MLESERCRPKKKASNDLVERKRMRVRAMQGTGGSFSIDPRRFGAGGVRSKGRRGGKNNS